MDGEGGRSKYPAYFPPPSWNALSYKAENSITLKVHLEYVRICVFWQILHIWP